MRTPKHVNSLWLQDTCVSCSLSKWNSYMEGTTKADGEQIRKLIKLHMPELYHDLSLEFYNPYEAKCVKKEGLLVYVHSSIEYFLKYN